MGGRGEGQRRTESPSETRENRPIHFFITQHFTKVKIDGKKKTIKEKDSKRRKKKKIKKKK